MTEFLVAEREEAIDGFQVPFGLLGSTMEFPFLDGMVVVALPVVKADPDDFYAACRFSEGLAADGDFHPETSWYKVFRLKFAYRFPEPDLVAKQDESVWNSAELSAEPEISEFVFSSTRKLDAAVSRWKAIARYETNSGIIGRADVGFSAQMMFKPGVRISRVSDGRIFRSFGGIFSSDIVTKLSADHWRSIQTQLCSESCPPLWFEYIFEAERRLDVDDVNGAVLSAAIACESAVRAVLWTKSPPIQNEAARRLFDTVSIQAILGRWSELTGLTRSEMKASGKSAVHMLLDLRNDLLHNAVSMADRKEEVRTLVTSIKTFIRETDKLIDGPHG